MLTAGGSRLIILRSDISLRTAALSHFAILFLCLLTLAEGIKLISVTPTRLTVTGQLDSVT